MMKTNAQLIEDIQAMALDAIAYEETIAKLEAEVAELQTIGQLCFSCETYYPKEETTIVNNNHMCIHCAADKEHTDRKYPKKLIYSKNSRFYKAEQAQPDSE